MKNRLTRTSLLVAAAGIALCTAGPVMADPPYVINISGATLQENFFNNPASTNDFIGVDTERGDNFSIRQGFTAFGQLQLAGSAASTLPLATGQPFRTFSGTGLVPWWVVNYRAVGSGNGLTELATYGITPTTVAGDLGIPPTDFAYCNTVRFILNGVTSNSIANPANPGAFPVRGNGAVGFGNRYEATPFTAPADGASSGAVLIDIAPVDVPSDWFVAIPGTSSFSLRPTQAGYGLNAATALNKDGTPTSYTYPGTANPVPFRNSIAPLPTGVKTFVQATAPGGGGVDAQTIFDTPTVYVPVAAAVNFGVGRQEITISELRHLFTTGRLPSGENLTAVTRDVGSGTRNAFMSSLHCDTSWGAGENIGALNVNNTDSALGTGTLPSTPAGSYTPSNKGGSGALETALINTRLGIGSTGAERGNGSWLTNTRLEVLAVKDDISGGTQFVRPTAQAVVNNGLIGQTDPSTGNPYIADGYRIAGFAVLATLGDPRNIDAAKGGYGYNGAVETNPGYPQMRNSEAATYVNNVSRAIDSFEAVGPDSNAFSPAERLASTFTLFGAVDRVATNDNPTAFVINPSRNNAAENYATTFGRLAIPAYTAFGQNAAANARNVNGLIPTRNTRVSGTYSDGTDGSSGYRTVGGATLTYNQRLNSRNRIAGDFNGDGLRDWNDIAELVAGVRFREGTNPGWTPASFTGPNNASFSDGDGTGASLCPEILGDFDGDGSLNRQDVRYFADGLALNPATGLLNRKEGFIRADTAFAGNIFGTTLATPKTYAFGDSRGDVCGPLNRHTKGFAPIGQDGRVDANDIDYVYAQFKRNAAITDGVAHWNNTAEAISFDLSADMNGDLVVDQNDIVELVTVILGTTLGDVNLDGVTNAADLAIITANLGQPGGWAQGDLNGDGIVNELDVALYNQYSCRADFNQDGVLNADDISDFITGYFNDPADVRTDYNSDGVINADDLGDYITTTSTAVAASESRGSTTAD